MVVCGSDGQCNPRASAHAKALGVWIHSPSPSAGTDIGVWNLARVGEGRSLDGAEAAERQAQLWCRAYL